MAVREVAAGRGRRAGRRQQRAFLGALAGAIRDGDAGDDGPAGPSGGDAWQTAIFADRGWPRPAAGPGLRGPLPRVPRASERPASRLAPRGPRPAFVAERLREAAASMRPSPRRRCGHERWPGTAPGGTGRDPQGRGRQGRGPGIVDAALAADARRRELQGEGDALRAERNAASKTIGEAIKAGAKPDGPRRPPCCGPGPPRSASALPRSTRPWPRSEARSTISCSASPTRRSSTFPVGGEEANVTVRTWGEQLARDPAVGGRDRGRRAVPDGATWERRPHWEIAEAARHDRPCSWSKDRRLRVPGLQGSRFGAPARPDHVVPRRPHPRERVHRGLAAHRGQPGIGSWHGPDPGQGRPDVRRHP